MCTPFAIKEDGPSATPNDHVIYMTRQLNYNAKMSDHVILMPSKVNYKHTTDHETPYVMFLTGPPMGLP